MPQMSANWFRIVNMVLVIAAAVTIVKLNITKEQIALAIVIMGPLLQELGIKVPSKKKDDDQEPPATGGDRPHITIPPNFGMIA